MSKFSMKVGIMFPSSAGYTVVRTVYRITAGGDFSLIVNWLQFILFYARCMIDLFFHFPERVLNTY